MVADVTAAVRGAGRLPSPPSGNTGVGITTGLRSRPADGLGVSLGWLSATFLGYFASPDDALAWASSFFGPIEYAEGRRWRGYDHTWMGEHGLHIGMRWVMGERLEVHLDIPATVLEALRPGRLVALLRSLHLHAHNVTRLDAALDDWCKVQTPAGLRELTTAPDDRNTLVRDDIVTRAKQTDFQSSTGKKGGDTWYLGARKGKGETLLRVYDKFKESEGETDCIRWEIQLRDVKARAALAQLVGYIDAQKKVTGMSGARVLEKVMGGWVASLLVSFVDFRDRNSDVNVSRAGRRFWWAALVLDANKAKFERVEPPLTVQRMHEHAYSNMLSMLAALADSAEVALGLRPGEWFEHVVRLGRERLSPRHKLALRAAGVLA